MTHQPDIAGRAEGERRRDAAHAIMVARRDAIIRRGQRALLLHVLSNGRATADDVRSAVDVPDGIDPKCLGSVPGPLARAGIIRRDGYTATCRPTAHARPVSVWVVRDVAAAERWLAAHPEYPDDPPPQKKAEQQCDLPFGE